MINALPGSFVDLDLIAARLAYAETRRALARDDQRSACHHFAAFLVELDDWASARAAFPYLIGDAT